MHVCSLNASQQEILWTNNVKNNGQYFVQTSVWMLLFIMDSYLVGWKPSSLGVYLEVFVGGDDGVGDDSGGVLRVTVTVSVSGTDLDHSSIWNRQQFISIYSAMFPTT